jgi:circadian clock protein KaiB
VDCFELEIVDVLQDPRRALDDGVLVTPTLVRLSPLPAVKIVGDLNEREQVLSALLVE